jgi:hypothetical protein
MYLHYPMGARLFGRSTVLAALRGTPPMGHKTWRPFAVEITVEEMRRTSPVIEGAYGSIGESHL